VGSAAVLFATAVVAAGAPSRGSFERAGAGGTPETLVEIDPATLPPITVSAEVAAADEDLDGAGATEIAVSLAENLEIESRALLGVDKGTLRAADAGPRLAEMEDRIDEALASGETTVTRYTFDSLHLSRVVFPEGQSSLSLGLDARGTVERITFDAGGDRLDRTTSPFAITFVLSRPSGGRWLIVQTLPSG
jgi:hypothetical protein